jgi:hypothetical protein
MGQLKPLLLVLLAISVLTLATSAEAVITGSLYKVPEATAQNAVPGSVPGGAAAVTFDVNTPMNFHADGATVSQWLTSGSAFNIVENTPGTLTSLMDNGISGTIVNFTGFVTVTNGQTFTVTHDDGLTLIIGGLDLGFDEGPTPPVTSTETYTGPSGTFPFQLVYGECCSGPAVLQIDLPFVNTPSVPEPTTVVLLGIGLVALGLSRARGRR